MSVLPSNRLKNDGGHHKGELRRSHHYNQYLQEEWDQYGEDHFVFSILEEIKDKRQVVKYEQWWLNQFLGSGANMYNIKTSAIAPAQGQQWYTPGSLADEDVLIIREAHLGSRQIPQQMLARYFGVSPSTISRICKNERRTGKLRERKDNQKQEKTWAELTEMVRIAEEEKEEKQKARREQQKAKQARWRKVNQAQQRKVAQEPKRPKLFTFNEIRRIARKYSLSLEQDTKNSVTIKHCGFPIRSFQLTRSRERKRCLSGPENKQ